MKNKKMLGAIAHDFLEENDKVFNVQDENELIEQVVSYSDVSELIDILDAEHQELKNIIFSLQSNLDRIFEISDDMEWCLTKVALDEEITEIKLLSS